MRIGLAAQCVASTHALWAAIATHLQEQNCCELFRFQSSSSRTRGPITPGIAPFKKGIDPNPSLRGAKRRSNPVFAWGSGLLRCARNDGRTHLLILATAFCPSLAKSFAPPRQEGAGKTGCAPHPRSRVQWALNNNAHEQTGSAETLRPSLRNGLTAYAVLSLVTGFLTPSSPSSVSCSRT